MKISYTEQCHYNMVSFLPNRYSRHLMARLCGYGCPCEFEFWFTFWRCHRSDISMALCKSAVSPVLMHWRYCSLALSHLSLVQDCSISIALAMEILQSCNKPLIFHDKLKDIRALDCILYSTAWWHYVMGMLSSILALCEGKAKLWCLLCCYPEQAVEQTVKFMVTLDAMVLSEWTAHSWANRLETNNFTSTHYLANVFAMHCGPRASPLCIQNYTPLTSLSFQVNRPSHS